MAEQDLTSEGIIESNERLTTCKTRIISSSHHMLRVDEEVLDNLTSAQSDELVNKVKNIINNQKVDVVIFEDYDKGLLNEQNIAEIISFLNEKNIPSCVDPKKENFLHYKGVTLFKPNFKEFTNGLKEEIKKGDIESMFDLASDFSKAQHIKNVMVTLSEHGVMLYNTEEQVHIPAEIRNISDVSGAGDTVISTAALALSKGVSGEDLVVLSNLAGGLVCEEVGVVPINKARLQAEFLKRSK